LGGDYFFGCQPGDVEKVLAEVGRKISGKTLISVAATVPLKFLKNMRQVADCSHYAKSGVTVQASYTAFCCEQTILPEEKQKIKTLLDMMGLSQEVNEKYMDAITALSGSGPGTFLLYLKPCLCRLKSWVTSRNLALASAAQTLMGTAKMVLDLKEEPAKIKDMTTTPAEPPLKPYTKSRTAKSGQP
jgi:pyrroline-5-carboxylate reductase